MEQLDASSLIRDLYFLCTKVHVIGVNVTGNFCAYLS